MSHSIILCPRADDLASVPSLFVFEDVDEVDGVRYRQVAFGEAARESKHKGLNLDAESRYLSCMIASPQHVRTVHRGGYKE